METFSKLKFYYNMISPKKVFKMNIFSKYTSHTTEYGANSGIFYFREVSKITIINKLEAGK